MAHRERWHFPAEIAFKYGLDSWRIRSSPFFSANVLGLLKPGAEFIAVTREGDWVQIDLGSSGTGWVYTKWCTTDGGALEVISPVPEYRPLETATSESLPQPELKRTRSAQQDLEWLIVELRQRRAMAIEARTYPEKVRAELRVEETMGKLDILGISEEQLLALDGTEPLSEPEILVQKLVDELVRSNSYPHADFTNPRAESCWLSTFFQSLWHSRVFHTIFEAQISSLPRGPRGTPLGALQETWELYKEAGERNVSVNALVKAWGRGYGDCAEAMGAMQDAPDLKPLSDKAALVPVPWTGRAPTQAQLWELISDMGVTDHAIVALDFSFPPLASAGMQTLALALKPNTDTDVADLGPDLRLVAMICYVEDLSHYVVFCKSLSEHGTWIFFNDLPSLGGMRGSQKRFNSWDRVANACAHFGCCPKMLLYENPVSGQALLEKHAPLINDVHDRPIGKGDGCTHM